MGMMGRSGMIKKNLTLTGLVATITVFVLTCPTFSFSKPPPSPSAPEAQFAVHRESLQVVVALTSASETNVVQKINLITKNEPLLDVLQRIAEETNISFRVPSDLLSKRISASIHVSTWEEGLNELLKGMNRLSVWDKNSHLTHVVILGGKDSTGELRRQSSSMSVSKTNLQHQAPIALTVASVQNSDKPSESNIKKLLRIQPGTSLPTALFNNTDINQYLKDNGIYSPKDWKVFNKARKVRKSLHRELRQILTQK